MKRVAVIGGGVAGLSAGIYAARCGFEVTLLEMHSRPGGNCTAWRRGAYVFEGGPVQLTGARASHPFYKVWKTLGALDGSVEITTMDALLTFGDEKSGVTLFGNVEKLRSHLLEISCEDKQLIKRMCADIRRFSKLRPPLSTLNGLKTDGGPASRAAALSMLPALRRIAALQKVSCRDYAVQFRHEGIRNALRAAEQEDDSVVVLLLALGALASGDAGFPAGGSLEFVGRMEKRFDLLGGTLRCGIPAERIVVEKGRAAGVMAGGERLDADAFIVATDALTAKKLFDVPLRGVWLEELRNGVRPRMSSVVSVGVDADLSDLARVCAWKPARPLTLGGQRYDYLKLRHFAGLEAYQPQGKTALTVSLAGDSYDFWKKAAAENRYEAEKDALAAEVLDQLYREIPRVAGRVEECDVATPLTYERCCGTHRGSFMALVPKNAKLRRSPCTLDNIERCYFAGHRLLLPGGLFAAAYTGRAAVQQLCRDMGVAFAGEEN